jgi:hypothetical protein
LLRWRAIVNTSFIDDGACLMEQNFGYCYEELIRNDRNRSPSFMKSEYSEGLWKYPFAPSFNIASRSLVDSEVETTMTWTSRHLVLLRIYRSTSPPCLLGKLMSRITTAGQAAAWSLSNSSKNLMACSPSLTILSSASIFAPSIAARIR